MKMVKNQNIISLLFLISLLVVPFIFSANNTIAQTPDVQNTSGYHLTALTTSDPIIVENDTAFETYGFPGNGSEVDPYRIENFNITTTDAMGIIITGTTVNFTIQNCYIDATSTGIYLNTIHLGTATIKNNLCIDNENSGIDLSDSFNTTVIDNILLSNGEGIYTDFCDYSIISNNTCSLNNVGIHLFDTYNTLVSKNNCSDNDMEGISLQEAWYAVVEDNICNNQMTGIASIENEEMNITNNICNNNLGGIYSYHTLNSNYTFNECSDNMYGIFFESCIESTASNNTLKNNGNGFYLETTEKAIFKHNIIENNSGYGVVIVDSLSINNVFHHNAFISNAIGLGNSQATDDGTSTLWYDVSTNEGNFWDDWVGTGNYSIDGSTGSFDLYPLGSSPIIAEFSTSTNQLFILLFVSLISVVSVLMRKFTKRK